MFLQQEQQSNFSSDPNSMFEDAAVDVCFDSIDDQSPIDTTCSYNNNPTIMQTKTQCLRMMQWMYVLINRQLICSTVDQQVYV